MSGLEPALVALFAEAGPALVYGGMEAGAGTAAGAAGAGAAGAGAAGAGALSSDLAGYGAMYGAGAEGGTSAGLLNAGAYGAGGATALTPEEIAMIQAMDGGQYAGAQSLLDAGASEPVASQNLGKVSDFEKYKTYMQNGFKQAGKAYSKLPQPVQGMMTSQAMQGLLGPPQQGQQTNIRPPSMGGGPGQGPQNANPYGRQQQMPQATPYAPSLVGGEDSEEMKRRKMMMMRGY